MIRTRHILLLISFVLVAAGISAEGSSEKGASGQDGSSGAAEAAESSTAEEGSSGDFKSAESAGFTLRWRVEESDLQVQLSAPTTGWVAVGFDPESLMGGADIIMGYVSGGEITVSDQYGNARTAHSADTNLGGSSSVSHVSGSEQNGSTTISFTIPLDSGEETDNPLTPGNTHTVIMAHGPDGADDFSTYHRGNRTIIEITL